MQTLLNQEYLKAVIDEILSDENQARKAESFKRMEIYNKRHAPFVEEKLKAEFKAETVQAMRKILSINVAERITDKMATVYQTPPTRSFTTKSSEKISDEQAKYIDDVFKSGKFNVKLQTANKREKYQNQTILQVLPAKGVLDMRVYHPHQIDVIPLESDPEQAFAYVISSYDRAKSLIGGDGKDETIADRNDAERKRRADMRFVWWSAEHNFITDGNAVIVQDDPKDVENPIKRLPFYDLCDEKENEFWIRKGNTVIDFTLDFSVVLSDTANINRLQGYAQGVIKSKDKPSDIRVGPENFIWLQLDPEGAVQPDVDFITPNPDMQASLDFLDRLVSYFLTAEGIDPKAVTSKGEGQKYGSGYERMLAMYEAFEASRDDIEKFQSVEQWVCEMIVAWTNTYNGTQGSPLTKIKPVALPEDLTASVQFAKPELVQTKTEVEDSELKLMDKGLRSEVMALMKIDGITEEEAIEKLKKIKDHKAMFESNGQNKLPAEGVDQNADDREAA